MKAPICIFIIACTTLLVRGQTSKAVIGQIKAGTEAGNAIIGILGDKQFTNRLSVIAQKIGPFLGAVGPVLSLITAFLPVQPSRELVFMKQKFSEMDAKFDRVFNQFGDVKNLLRETSLKSQYGTYEQKIKGLSYRLRLMLEATPNASQGQKNDFIESYKSSYHNSAYNLWSGMMGHMGILSYDIAKSAMSYTKYDRKKFQHFMKGLTQLVLQGVKVRLAYLKVVGRRYSYQQEQGDWARKIKQLISRINSFDILIKGQYHPQSKKDILELAATYKGSYNWNFSPMLFRFLVNKYFWRDWFVVVYNPVRGTEPHWVKVCGGHILFRTYGFNIVVASVDKSKRAINTYVARSKISAWKLTRKWNFWIGWVSRDAKDIYYNTMPSELTNGCNYASVGIIESTAQPYHYGSNGRLVSTQNGRYEIHAFG